MYSSVPDERIFW